MILLTIRTNTEKALILRKSNFINHRFNPRSAFSNYSDKKPNSLSRQVRNDPFQSFIQSRVCTQVEYPIWVEHKKSIQPSSSRYGRPRRQILAAEGMEESGLQRSTDKYKITVSAEDYCKNPFMKKIRIGHNFDKRDSFKLRSANPGRRNNTRRGKIDKNHINISGLASEAGHRQLPVPLRSLNCDSLGTIAHTSKSCNHGK